MYEPAMYDCPSSLRPHATTSCKKNGRYLRTYTHANEYPFQVVIFNWKGHPTKTDMLDRLNTMREAACVVNRGQRKNVFGHLIILLRDVPTTREDQAYAVVFGKEDPDTAESDEEADHMTERNKTRDQLQASFQSTMLVCMPPPHADIHRKYCTVHYRSGPPMRNSYLGWGSNLIIWPHPKRESRYLLYRN